MTSAVSLAAADYSLPRALTAPVRSLPRALTAPVRSLPRALTAPVRSLPRAMTTTVRSLPRAMTVTFTTSLSHRDVQPTERLGIEVFCETSGHTGHTSHTSVQGTYIHNYCFVESHVLSDEECNRHIMFT